MATSGTVATTTIDTAKVIEHSFRRCKVPASKQTAESVQIAKDNLYLLLTHLANRGLNLWCVERQYIGLNAGQATYSSAPGTIDLLNVVYTQPTRITGTDSSTATSYTTQVASTTVLRVAIKLSTVTANDTLTISSSIDGVTWTTAVTSTRTDWATDTWYWFNLDPSVTATYFKAEFTGAATFTEFYLASAIYDLPVSQWNRDTFAAINNKTQQGRPSTTYYFEKLMVPRVTLWPVPNNDYDHLTLFVHRQVQDVGTMVQTLEIPQRWVEAIIWQLAMRLCYELDGVPPDVLPNVMAMGEKTMLEVEDEETDSAPIYLASNIRVYTA